MDIHEEIWRYFQINQYSISSPYVATEGDRIALAKFFAKLGYKKGAEIGVYRGQYSEALCELIPDLSLLCIDPWGAYSHFGVPVKTRGLKYAEARMHRAIGRLQKYPKAEIKRMTSVEASGQVEDGQLDFVYIDALHDFDNIMTDLIAWVPKVRIGGIVSGHDYIYDAHVQVIPAVNAYTNAHGITKVYLTKNHDECESFFWVKE